MTEEEPFTEIDVLVEAKRLVSIGWVQGTFTKEVIKRRWLIFKQTIICYCSSAAIRKASQSSGLLLERATILFCEANSIPFHNIEKWNDKKGRKKKEVLTAFDKAIVHAKIRRWSPVAA